MIAAERQQNILNALTSHEYISLPQLADMLGVSVMTVRRDVSELSAKGQLTAVRGGVKSSGNFRKVNSGLYHHPSIFRAALSEIGERRIIFLDSGPLCRELAQYISWREDMTVVTNDFEIASDIIKYTPAVLYFIGGELRRSDNTFHRRIALDALKTLNFELLFLAPEKWNEKGVWHQEEHRKIWYQSLIEASGKIVLLAKSQDFGKTALFHLYPLEKANLVLTDDEKIASQLKSSHPNV